MDNEEQVCESMVMNVVVVVVMIMIMVVVIFCIDMNRPTLLIFF